MICAVGVVASLTKGVQEPEAEEEKLSTFSRVRAWLRRITRVGFACGVLLLVSTICSVVFSANDAAVKAEHHARVEQQKDEQNKRLTDEIELANAHAKSSAGKIAELEAGLRRSENVRLKRRQVLVIGWQATTAARVYLERNAGSVFDTVGEFSETHCVALRFLRTLEKKLGMLDGEWVSAIDQIRTLGLSTCVLDECRKNLAAMRIRVNAKLDAEEKDDDDDYESSHSRGFLAELWKQLDLFDSKINKLADVVDTDLPDWSFEGGKSS